jgi:hypothetical protein
MANALTLKGSGLKRIWSFIAGAGMIAASAMTIQHFFAANFPESIYEGSFCDISAFFNCDSSAFSSIAHFGGVPMGWFGLLVGSLVVLGSIFPTVAFEKTTRRSRPPTPSASCPFWPIPFSFKKASACSAAAITSFPS